MSNSNTATSPEKGATVAKNPFRTGYLLPSLGPKPTRVSHKSPLRRMATHGINRQSTYSLGCSSETF